MSGRSALGAWPHPLPRTHLLGPPCRADYTPRRLLPPNSRSTRLHNGLAVEYFDFAPSLAEHLHSAALVISHAGARACVCVCEGGWRRAGGLSLPAYGPDPHPTSLPMAAHQLPALETHKQRCRLRTRTVQGMG